MEPVAPCEEVRNFAGTEVVARKYPCITYATMPGPFSPAAVAKTHVAAEPAVNRRTQLHLSITTPHDAMPGADCPVVVFIHGGSYNFGDRTETWFDGRQLARDGIILVACDYRLGAPGFLEFGDAEPNHYRGIDDCAAALQWVQQHIERFGGDPTNVTLVGQSAGAGIVLWLGRKDHYQGLFRRAWALSPAYPRKKLQQRTGQLRWFLPVPLSRKRLDKYVLAHPEQFQKRWLRFVRLHPTDMTAGPRPFNAAELAEFPLIVSCTDRELDAMELPGVVSYTPKWLRHRINQKWGARYSFQTEVDGSRWLHDLSNDAMIRRYVAQTAAGHPQTWAIYFTQAGHCDDIAPLFDAVPVIPPSETWVNKQPHRHAVAATHRILRTFARGTLPSWPATSTAALPALTIDVVTGKQGTDTTTLPRIMQDFPPQATASRRDWTRPA